MDKNLEHASWVIGILLFAIALFFIWRYFERAMKRPPEESSYGYRSRLRFDWTISRANNSSLFVTGAVAVPKGVQELADNVSYYATDTIVCMGYLPAKLLHITTRKVLITPVVFFRRAFKESLFTVRKDDAGWHLNLGDPIVDGELYVLPEVPILPWVRLLIENFNVRNVSFRFTTEPAQSAKLLYVEVFFDGAVTPGDEPRIMGHVLDALKQK